MRIQSLSAYSGHFNRPAQSRVAFAGVIEEQQALLTKKQTEANAAKEAELSKAKRQQMNELNAPFCTDGDIPWSKTRLLRLVDEVASAELKTPGNIAAAVLSPVTIAAGIALGGLCLWLGGDVPGGFPLSDLLPNISGRAPKEKMEALFHSDEARRQAMQKLEELVSKDGLVELEAGKGYFLTDKGLEILAVVSE